MNTLTNPFFSQYGTPHETIPFGNIGLAELEEAINVGMKREDEEIAAIVNSQEMPNFRNTIVALEHSGDLLERATTVMYNLLSAETNDELEDFSQRIAPVLSEHGAHIMQNELLFARVRAVREGKEVLDAEERMLLEKTYDAFERSGATLQKEGKDRFRAIKAELAQLSLRFSQNLLKETNRFYLHVENIEDLEGLPNTQLEQAAMTAQEKQLRGWVFTLQAPSYVPFMTYVKNRELRKQMFLAYNTRCTHDNEENNFQIVKQIVNLRRELAQLLGYPTYADYVLRRRMAESVDNVYVFLKRLIEEYKAPAQQEVDDVRQLARQEEGEHFVLQPWDFSYYAHKLKMERYNLDQEMLRPYFELSRVKDGVFGLATQLYGISFKENPDIPVYHKDVAAYEVFDENNRFLAVLYMDFHPRETKQGGAWMTAYREADEKERPHVAVTMNFSKPTSEKPALLTLEEVETFLHEFGHALHGMFANTRYRSLSGTNVYWDFVELPSQFMENYAIETGFLKTFAFHYQTGEPMPEELIQRVVESRNFNAAYACMRQVAFGLLDMAFYTCREPFAGGIRDFEKEAWKEAQLLPSCPETCMSVQFGHIMSGGYAAGYYSYKWAEVLDADAFSLFQQEGIFNRSVAERFRENILSKGGTVPPMELYKRFRGQEPTIDALLRRNGIRKSQ